MHLNTFIETFDIRDIDQDLLKSRAKAETDRVWKPYQNRSRKDAYISCLQGHVAEIHVISQGYKDDPRPFLDQINLEGDTIDNKVLDCTDKPQAWLDSGIRRILNDMTEKKLKYGDGVANQIYFWVIRNRYTCKLYRIFKWSNNDKKFE